MFDFLFQFHKEDGYYSLALGGYIFFAVLVVVLMVATAFIGKRKKTDDSAHSKSSNTMLTVKQLVFCAIAVALSFITSYLKLFEMPWGGSVTLFSMLFITLIGYWYGLKVGLLTGFVYGILQFLQGGSYILSPLQVCFDYIFAFMALGLSGVFAKSKNGLIKGYLLGIFLRGAFHAIGGYLYWMDFMPDNFPHALSVLYPILYNYSYILVEGAVTVIILLAAPVASAMKQVKKMATE